MLSFYRRFMFQFIFIIVYKIHLIHTDNSSNRCQSDWYYLSEETLCITFATSQGGDVSWYNSYKACQTSSAQLLTFSDTFKLKSIQKIFDKLEDNKNIYLENIQHGSWIANANWSKDDLCDDETVPMEDLQLNCFLLTIGSNDQSFCLKRVSCEEKHPFVCQKKESIESTMERWNFWKCLIPIWCIIDHAQQKKKEQQQREQALLALAQAQALQEYLNQFNFELPEELQFVEDEQALMKPVEGLKAIDWFILIIGGCVTLLMMCSCFTALIFIYRFIRKRRLRQNPEYRDGSFDSVHSNMSR